MSLPVAVQVYSVRDDAKADLRATLEKIGIWVMTVWSLQVFTATVPPT